MDVDIVDHPIQTTPVIEKTSQACKRPFIPSTSPKLGKHSRTSENDKVFNFCVMLCYIFQFLNIKRIFNNCYT